jgi:transcriptional regulator with XRE-family HTH domain
MAHEDAALRKQWGDALRSRREERGLTQEAVADLAGVDQGTVSRVEAGQIGFGNAYLRIANVLGVTFEVTAP